MKTKNRLLNILLIEDNQNDILLIRIALEKSGIKANLNTVTNGEDAVNYLNEIIGKKETLPDLILLDINLPKITGLEVLKKIKVNKSTRSIPVVIFTSSDSSSDMNYCYQNGAGFYIKKPNNINSFKEVMKYISLTIF